MFVTTNRLMRNKNGSTAVNLKEEYIKNLKNGKANHNIRMIVLDNIGVTFRSLFAGKFSKALFQKNFSSAFPFDLEATGLRMYRAMWNYRATLHLFNDAYKKFLTDNSLEESKVRDAIKQDYAKYTEWNKRDKAGNFIISHTTYSDYRDWLYNVADKKGIDIETIKKVHDFNDSLGTVCKEIRLGTTASVQDNHGVYNQKITNPGTTFYNKDDEVYGLYMDPEIARHQLNMIDTLFDKVVNIIVEAPKGINITDYIDIEKYEDWFKNQKGSGSFKIQISDVDVERGKVTTREGTLELGDKGGNIVALPLKLIQVAKHLYMLNNYSADIINDDPDAKKAVNNIKFTDAVTGKETTLEWAAITNTLFTADGGHEDFNTFDTESEVPSNLAIGISKYQSEDGKWHIVDSRVSDFFNLMFHGLVGTENLYEFTEKEINTAATDAEYRRGIFIDPVIVYDPDKKDPIFAVSQTGGAFYASNLTTRFPQAYIDLTPKPADTKPTEEEGKGGSKPDETGGKTSEKKGKKPATTTTEKKPKKKPLADRIIERVEKLDYYKMIQGLKGISYLRNDYYRDIGGVDITKVNRIPNAIHDMITALKNVNRRSTKKNIERKLTSAFFQSLTSYMGAVYQLYHDSKGATQAGVLYTLASTLKNLKAGHIIIETDDTTDSIKLTFGKDSVDIASLIDFDKWKLTSISQKGVKGNKTKYELTFNTGKDNRVYILSIDASKKKVMVSEETDNRKTSDDIDSKLKIDIIYNDLLNEIEKTVSDNWKEDLLNTVRKIFNRFIDPNTGRLEITVGSQTYNKIINDIEQYIQNSPLSEEDWYTDEENGLQKYLQNMRTIGCK